MSASPLAPHSASPGELRERLDAERGEKPFLVYRDADDHQRLMTLEDEPGRLTIGRSRSSDVMLDWDREVSRSHAELTLVGDQWAVDDDGLSSNGTYVNGVRVSGRQRLRDGDLVRCGSTLLAYCNPGRGASGPTLGPEEQHTLPALSAAQRRVLLALCRPYRDRSRFVTPASNTEIARELVVSVNTVKTQLRLLYRMFGIDELAQGEKRARLVEAAFRTGVVSDADLVD